MNPTGSDAEPPATPVSLESAPALAVAIAGSAPFATRSTPASTCTRGSANRRSHRSTRSQAQERMLRSLVRKAQDTRFGRDHGFDAIRSVADFQAAVPLRTYEDLWNDYLRDHYPVFDNLTWPGRIPFLALTSGTTQGATKYIPVSREMVASNRKAAQTMVAFHLAARPDSRLFHGRLFFLGGSTDLEAARARRPPGRPERDRRARAHRRCSGPTPSRRSTWPSNRTGTASSHSWPSGACREPITLVGGVPSWLLVLFQRLLELTGKATIAEVWPTSRWSSTAGVKFDPYREPFRDDPRPAPTSGSRRPTPAPRGSSPSATRRPASSGCSSTTASSTSSSRSTSSTRPDPTRHWLGDVQAGRQLRDRRLDLRGAVGARHRRHGAVRVARPAAAPLHRADQVHALGLRRAPDQRGGRGGDRRGAVRRAAASVRDWHVGPVFDGALGHHQYVVEFLDRPADAGSVPPAARRRPLAAQRRLPGPPRRGGRPAAAGPDRRPSRGRSTPGCARGASSAASTRSRGWTGPGTSPGTSSPSSARRQVGLASSPATIPARIARAIVHPLA